jgi:hypothetical protein
VYISAKRRESYYALSRTKFNVLRRSNAAVAVPWAIIGAIGISGVLGTGEAQANKLVESSY